jgi:hypothetical protein
LGKLQRLYTLLKDFELFNTLPDTIVLLYFLILRVHIAKRASAGRIATTGSRSSSGTSSAGSAQEEKISLNRSSLLRLVSIFSEAGLIYSSMGTASLIYSLSLKVLRVIKI